MRFTRLVKFAVDNEVQFLASQILLQVENKTLLDLAELFVEYECMYEAVVAEPLQC